MRRPWIIALAALCTFVGLWACAGEQPAPAAGPPKNAADCRMIGLWSNGYHTSFSMPAALFPEGHPFRKLYPTATHFMLGWGDLPFYRSRGDDLWLGVQALMPGGESGMHILAGMEPVETWYRAKEVIPIALSAAGAQALVAYIDDSFERTPDGAAVQIAFEQDGYFLKGRKDFHALNVCNHWSARALRRAGVPVNASLAFTGDMAVALIAPRALQACPPR
jgi:uncharacterized protein (TIGR02117 family)